MSGDVMDAADLCAGKLLMRYPSVRHWDMEKDMLLHEVLEIAYLTGAAETCRGLVMARNLGTGAEGETD